MKALQKLFNTEKNNYKLYQIYVNTNNKMIKWEIKMNKAILKILITSLILLIGIGAVSAMDDNSTDGVLSVEQTDEISAIDNNDTVISVSENNSEILSADCDFR